MTAIADLTSRFVASEHALFEALDHEGVILDTRIDIYFGLNEAAANVWGSITKGSSVDEAARTLSTRFAIPLSRARADAMELVEELLARKLICRLDS